MPKLMDSKRLVWIKCYGIPMHAWTKNFFKVLHSLFGEYMYTDKPTSNKEQLDVSHFVICTTSLDVINTIIMENTNGGVFAIRLVEKANKDCANCHNCKNKRSGLQGSSKESSNEDREDLGGNHELKTEDAEEILVSSKGLNLNSNCLNSSPNHLVSLKKEREVIEGSGLGPMVKDLVLVDDCRDLG